MGCGAISSLFILGGVPERKEEERKKNEKNDFVGFEDGLHLYLLKFI